MEQEAHSLHYSILEEVEANNWDVFDNTYVGKVDPLVAQAIEQQRQTEVAKENAKSKRAQFAFTEPYWRAWGSDLKVLETNSNKVKQVEKLDKIVRPKTKHRIRTAPNPRVTTHKFGTSKTSKLEPNVYKAKKTVNFLRECAGKSNIMPTMEELRWTPNEVQKGGYLSASTRAKVRPPLTQFCEIPNLSTTNKNTLAGGTTVFSKAPRYSRPSTNPSSASGGAADTEMKSGGSRPSTAELGISFTTDERFRKSAGASSPGPGEYQVRK